MFYINEHAALIINYQYTINIILRSAMYTTTTAKQNTKYNVY